MSSIGTPPSLEGVVGLGDAEVFFVNVPLGEGAQTNLRQKFSLSGQRGFLGELGVMLEDGTIYLGDTSLGEIRTTGVRRVYTHRFWTEVQFTVEMPPKSPGGDPIKAAFAGIVPAHKFQPGVSALIIVDENTVALIKMYRFHGAVFATLPGQRKGWRIEAPRGGYKPGESPEAGALREATEEAGISQRADTQVIDLGVVEPDSGLLMSQVALRAVTGVDIDSSKVSLDVTEAPTETLVLSVDKVLEMIGNGEIVCGITIAAIMRALAKGLIRSSSLGA